jgi:hypothetical protein
MHLSTRGEVMAWGYTIWFLGERISMGAVPVSPFEDPHEALSAALAGIEEQHGVQIHLF